MALCFHIGILDLLNILIANSLVDRNEVELIYERMNYKVHKQFCKKIRDHLRSL